MAATKLIAPNGAAVSVDSKRVESLLRFGFTEPAEKTKAPAKKAASTKSKSKS